MKTQNKIYIISAVFLSAAICLAVFLIWPIFDSIRKDSAELLKAKADMSSLQNKVNGLEAFQKNYKNYQSDLDKIDQLFVDSKNPINFIQFLERASSDSGVQSEISLTPNGQTQTDAGGWSYINFQIDSNGDFMKILEFSKKLENSPYLIKIQSLSVKGTEDKTSGAYLSGNLEASFLIKVFAK